MNTFFMLILLITLVLHHQFITDYNRKDCITE